MTRVLVIGDIMLDRYWDGSVRRISPEAPVPVVNVDRRFDRPGGAANVAMNVASLGGSVTLIGAVGQDEAGEVLKRELTKRGVETVFVESDQPTITKLRIVSNKQQLIRIDSDARLTFNRRALLSIIDDEIHQHDVVVLSDYGKGTLASSDLIIDMAIELKVPVVVDPKGVEYARYRGATVITPNVAELEAVVGTAGSDMELLQKAEQLLVDHAISAMLLTRSEKGVTLLQPGQPAISTLATAREVFDVTGAGDTVAAMLALSMARGLSLIEASELANRAAGIAVGKFGAATVTAAEMIQATGKLLTASELRSVVAAAKDRGQTIVMTNGCFDILHVGHIRCLEEARTHGDALIVAVNSDASVHALKGEGRPVLRLSDRMQMLAALSCVDWVVSFDGETPADLIEQILPNILVKGGDYSNQMIAGEQAVIASGGRVVRTDIFESHSTSSIISAISSASGAHL